MGDRAPDDAALFLRCWAPDLAADALMESEPQAQQEEWHRVLSSLRLRCLEAQAAELATRSAEQDRAQLRSVRMEIAQLKEMLSAPK
jgi:hypothetical protein